MKSSSQNLPPAKSHVPAAGQPFLIPVLIAVLVGLLSGLTAVSYIKLINVTEFVFEKISVIVPYHLGNLFIPAFGGLLVGLWMYKVMPQAQGQGVPETLKAIALKKGKMDFRVIPGKMIGTALSLGSGASVGREGPIVQIGAALGSNIARLFKFSELKTRNLIACGTAAGIATVFNAPITGVMYSLEMILKDFGAKALGTVVIAAVASSVICRVFLGESPAFISPSFSLVSPWEIFIYIALGILSGLIAIVLNRGILGTAPVWKKLAIPAYLRPAVGGLLIGMMALTIPHVLGTGFEFIQDVLHDDHLPWKILVLLTFMKIVSSSISLTSGNPGGLFGPTLFIGAMMGGALGQFLYHRLPFPTAAPGAYALVGMASVFAGAAHAPLTAMFLVFELTGNYHMVLPVMTAVVISTYLSQFISKDSLDVIELKEHGADLQTWEEMKILGGMEVRDAMSHGFEVIPNHLPARSVAEKLLRHKDKVLFLKNKKDRLTGMITPEHLQDIFLDEETPGIIAEDMAMEINEVCHPEEPLAEAARVMVAGSRRYLPVVASENADKIVGILKSEDVFLTYTRLAAKRHLQDK